MQINPNGFLLHYIVQSAFDWHYDDKWRMLCTITSSTNAEWKELLLFFFFFLGKKGRKRENSRWESNLLLVSCLVICTQAWVEAAGGGAPRIAQGQALACLLNIAQLCQPGLFLSQGFMKQLDPFCRLTSQVPQFSQIITDKCLKYLIGLWTSMLTSERTYW